MSRQNKTILSLIISIKSLNSTWCLSAQCVFLFTRPSTFSLSPKCLRHDRYQANETPPSIVNRWPLAVGARRWVGRGETAAAGWATAIAGRPRSPSCELSSRRSLVFRYCGASRLAACFRLTRKSKPANFGSATWKLASQFNWNVS